MSAYISQGPLSLEDIPPLSEDARNDRIWRFIALIFLAHAGVIDIWQDGPTMAEKCYSAKYHRPEKVCLSKRGSSKPRNLGLTP